MRPIAKPTLPLFLLLGPIFFVTGAARAEKEEWKNIGPYSGVINAIAIDPLHPDVIYAGTDKAGVFKTTDGGGSWVTANDGLGVHNAIEVYAFVIDQKDPSVIIVGTGDGIFRSKNHGLTWALVKRKHDGVSSLAIDPSNDKIIYAGLRASFGGANILKSTDRGATWTDLVRVPTTEPVSTIAIDPTNSKTIFAEPVSTIAIDPTNSKTIFAGGMATIAKTVDGGANWTRCLSE